MPRCAACVIQPIVRQVPREASSSSTGSMAASVPMANDRVVVRGRAPSSQRVTVVNEPLPAAGSSATAALVCSNASRSRLVQLLTMLIVLLSRTPGVTHTAVSDPPSGLANGGNPRPLGGYRVSADTWPALASDPDHIAAVADDPVASRPLVAEDRAGLHDLEIVLTGTDASRRDPGTLPVRRVRRPIPPGTRRRCEPRRSPRTATARDPAGQVVAVSAACIPAS